MRVLYHYVLCPYSRKVRLSLQEKKLDFVLESENFWERRLEFLELNPAGQVPTFIDLNGTVVADSNVICEYLEDAYPESGLLGQSVTERAEVRRLIAFFDGKMSGEVTLPLLFEKILKKYVAPQASQGPNSVVIRNAKQVLKEHLDYISWLVDRRNWLAGEELSQADLCAAAHLSVIDYFGDVPWDHFEAAKNWYARLKSRPSFRPILEDRAPGIAPCQHYKNLDF